ncbi:MAG: patatin, partial [Sphingobacteriales bacterium]
MNKHILSLLLISAILLCTIRSYSQTNGKTPPKIGLALSGGGAKGLAYIGLLKKIDSLGIKVDYVTGTSMGGVLGGLYAMGYSGKQLEDIVNNISWDRVLTNKVPLSQVNIEEKDEYGNYMLELPIFNGKPALPNSMIEGQYLSEILNTYAYPSRNITDFSKLYIPLQITTSDIINGGLVMQKLGSLPLVIRATMAIPAVFSTVYIDGKVLVDGGLDRNFPVDEIKNMGADYVIGGYTGFHILKEKEIKGPLNIIMQTYAFNGVKDSKQQMEKTDLLIDYTDILTGYSSADFQRYKEILRRGEIEANKYLPQLIKLAEQQRANGISVTPRNIQ